MLRFVLSQMSADIWLKSHLPRRRPRRKGLGFVHGSGARFPVSKKSDNKEKSEKRLHVVRCDVAKIENDDE